MHLIPGSRKFLTARARFVYFVYCVYLCVFCGAILAQPPQHPQAVVVAQAPAKATVGKIDVTSAPDSLKITIPISSAVTPAASLIANPNRLVLDFPGCEIRNVYQHIPVDQEPIKDLRVSLYSEHPPTTRVVVDLTSSSDFHVKPWANGNVVVEIPLVRAHATSADSVKNAAILYKELVHKEPAAAAPQTSPAPESTPEASPSPTPTTAPPVSTTQPDTAPQPVSPSSSDSASPSVSTAPPTSSPPANAPTSTIAPPSATTSQPPPQPETTASNNAPSQPALSPPPLPAPPASAYDLMTKAKALTVTDLQNLEAKAAADDPEAETMLALAYHAGVLLKQDDSQAITLLHKAADHGYMAAEESLGIFSESGIGMPQPAPAEALSWYEKAVQHGSMDAATSIALLYANGKGVVKDPAQAVAWFRRAADGGDASAQYNLALMYERGESVPKDYRQAVQWLTKAADQNLVPAMMDLAEFSMRPPDPSLAKDVPKAVKYYEKAADSGNAMAQINLATIFSKGIDGKPDYEQAAKWYQKAAAQGDRDGEFGLGVSYALGRGVPVDYEQARRWFTSAADQGQVQAEFNVAIMYDEGKGIPADRDLAAHYYEMAAEKGMVKAQFRYGMLLARTTESHNDRIAAYKWLMLAQDSIKESSSALSDVRKSMSEPEIAEAEHEVDSWRLAHRNLRH
jgi:TPR repeat protein